MHENLESSQLISSRNSCLTAVLRMAGLRPTKQRVSLAQLLFTGSHRHISAEMLHLEAKNSNINVSLATVYNTLNQFSQAGLVREISVDATKSYYDTNTSDHHHFYCVEENEVTDIPLDSIEITGLPKAPNGMIISNVDVVIRVKKVN